MLQQVDAQEALERASYNDGLRLLLKAHLWRLPDGELPWAYTDNPEQPELIILRHGVRFTILAPPERYPQLATDLLAERIQQSPAWPDAGLAEAWSAEPERENGPRGKRLEMHATGTAFAEAAFAAGFSRHPGDHHEPHWFYCMAGRSDFTHFVQHACRVCEGRELFELLRGGIKYDDTGEYLGKCLDAGPSFVCEVTGGNGGTIPVCFSMTHLSGSMGGIFTPPEHRGHGYGRSMAAFQLSFMLRTRGEAWCHVNTNNPASYRNLDVIGMPRLAEPVTWCTLLWPPT
jgi:GNAT superfamily N-acetyltransferase